MKGSILCIALALAGLMSCQRSGQMADKYVNLYYAQTHCADPWPSASTDAETLMNVSQFLASRNLYVASLNIRHGDSLVTCQACNCSTGNAIIVSTFDDATLIEKYQAIGFTR